MTIDALLQPIDADAPCGADMSFSTEFDAVQELRREDDPTLPQGEFVTELKAADWPAAAALCESLLKGRTKDLRLAGWLLEAWTHQRGLAGLADGLGAVDQLCTRFWADIHPLPDDGDQELRIGNLAWVLGRVEALSRTVPLLKAGARSAGLVHIDAAKARQQAASRSGQELDQEEGVMGVDDVARLQRDTPREFLAANLTDAGRAIEALATLEKTIDGLLGADGPGFSSARKALEATAHASRRFAKEAGVLDDSLAVDAASAEEAKEVIARAGGTGEGSVGVPHTRAQALQQLRIVAEFFRRTEPHSPVAYLADKAAKWGDMPLHVWLRAVMKDGGTLAQLEEMLGVASPPAGEGH